MLVLLSFALSSQVARNRALTDELAAKELKSKESPRRRQDESADDDSELEPEAAFREVGPDDVPYDLRAANRRPNKTTRSASYSKANRSASNESSKESAREPSFDTSAPSFSDVAFTETMMDSPSSKFDL